MTFRPLRQMFPSPPERTDRLASARLDRPEQDDLAREEPTIYDGVEWLETRSNRGRDPRTRTIRPEAAGAALKLDGPPPGECDEPSQKFLQLIHQNSWAKRTTAGPRMTMNNAGRMQIPSGKIILIGS